ncbi:MAG: DUF4214 domain-containing protein [Burkholderiaceae bacterium]|nr:DUF4214 domain-containing protein [Burkholderiaceae bacterium]
MSQDLYRFDITNGRLTGIFEFDDGVWKRKTLDANETASVGADGKVTLTENKGSYQEIKVYAPTGQTNTYALQSQRYTDGNNQSLPHGSYEDQDHDGFDDDDFNRDGYDDDDMDHDGSEDDDLRGSDANDDLRGGAGDDRLSDGAGNDRLDGGDGDDRFEDSLGDDSIVGGNGVDTVVVKYSSASYQLSKTASGTTLRSATDGTDTLQGVERVQFADKSLALDVDGTAGKAFRLYQAAFDRKPDAEGLGYWIKSLDKDANLVKAAAGFVNSQEFQAQYGANASIDTLVTKLYQNVLHREPEQAGKDYWVQELSQGRKSLQEALADFSESRENVANLVGVMGDGVEYVPFLG